MANEIKKPETPKAETPEAPKSSNPKLGNSNNLKNIGKPKQPKVPNSDPYETSEAHGTYFVRAPISGRQLHHRSLKRDRSNFPKGPKSSRDLYDKYNYTGPGIYSFEGRPSRGDPDDFSNDFEDSFFYYKKKRDNDEEWDNTWGDKAQKYFEDNDQDVWDALRDAKEEAGDNDTVYDVAYNAALKLSGGKDEDLGRIYNAIIFSHFYGGSKFEFSPNSHYKKLQEKELEDYRKYLPKEWR